MMNLLRPTTLITLGLASLMTFMVGLWVGATHSKGPQDGGQGPVCVKVGDLETCMKDLDGVLPEGWRERVQGTKDSFKELILDEVRDPKNKAEDKTDG